ncbi:MAG: hypothetical protein WD403_12515 [Pirellulales bacterium]
MEMYAVSLNEFLLNVRTAARLIAPTAIADSPRLGSAEIEDTLRSAAVWATPRAVEGFDHHEFQFLPSSEQESLRRSVEGFLNVVRHVPSNKPATNQQVRKALPAFKTIIEVLRPDRYADPDAFVIGKQVEQQAHPLPSSVAELRFETGDDATGQPAIWVWVVFKDEAGQNVASLTNVKHVRELLETAVRKLGVKHWPYVRFRTASDLSPLVKKRDVAAR